MSGPFGASPWGYNPSTGFYDHTISQSLRLNGTNAYLSKTNFGTATNTSKRTFSTWIKTCDDSYSNYDHIVGAGSSNIDGFGFDSNERFAFLRLGADVQTGTARIRDVNAWMHVMFTWDSTAGNWYIYINGVQDSTGSASAALTKLGQSGQTNTIGKRSNAGQYIHGYLAQTVFLDGTIGSVSDFGETKDGIWIPKDISAAGLTFGTNGYFLDYADSSDLGKDVSGRGNHWTSNNLAAEDQVPDSPTNNFATLNSAHNHPNINFSEGNLRHQNSSNNRGVVAGFLLPKSGVWYWEHLSVSFNYPTDHELHSVGINVPEVDLDGSRGGRSTGVTYGSNDGKKYVESGTGATYGASWEENDIIGVEFDADSGTINFSKNSTFQGDISITASKDWLPFVGMGGGTSSSVGIFNFGQDSSFSGQKTSGSANASDANGIGDFYYSPPSGALALCTANLPDPTIGPGQTEQADDNFNTVIWTGNGTDGRTITGVNFAADWVWVKSRSVDRSHHLQDIVRGFNDGTKVLRSNATTAESGVPSDQYGFVGTINSDGYTLEDGTSDGVFVNNNSETYVAWNWKAGGSASSISVDAYSSGVPNTASSVSANQDAGFSIVSWTGSSDGSGGDTVGHGLSKKPELIIVKNRDTTDLWSVWNKDLTSEYILYWHLTNAENGSPASFGTHSNQVIGVDTDFATNKLGSNMIAYCFHSVEGYSKVGSYKGNSSGTDGAFVYTGFAPTWVMGKVITQTGRWWIYDSARSPQMLNSIGTGAYLAANASSDEASDSGANAVQLLSNGFKVNTTNAEWNGSSHTYIYLAFAKAPFKFANAR